MPLPTFILRNGACVLPAQANITIFNPALYVAYGVYESMQVVGGVAFAQEAHLDRLFTSAAILGLVLPADRVTFRHWIADALAVNAATDCVLRLFVVGAENGGASVAFVWPQPNPSYPAAYYEHGATAVTFEGQRFWPMAKSLNNLASEMARRKAQAAGAHEGLLYHDGYLTEGSNSNLFAVVDGVVITPPADQVLAGVTRDLVLGLATEHGIPAREAPLPLAGMPHWRECFITSTSRHVMPITAIDGRPVGDGAVGPVTRRLAALFADRFDCVLRDGGEA